MGDNSQLMTKLSTIFLFIGGALHHKGCVCVCICVYICIYTCTEMIQPLLLSRRKTGLAVAKLVSKELFLSGLLFQQICLDGSSGCFLILTPLFSTEPNEARDVLSNSPFSLDQLLPKRQWFFSQTALCQLCLRSLAADSLQHLPAPGWTCITFGSSSSTQVNLHFCFTFFFQFWNEFKKVGRAVLTLVC